MSGRYERNERIDESTREGLEDFPPILKRYYHKSARYQATSRRVMINAVKRFVKYLNNDKGVDITADDWYKKVTPETIHDYFDSIKVKVDKDGKKKIISDSSINTTWKYLNNFFEFLMRGKYIEENPVATTEGEFPRSRVKKPVVYMTEDEVYDVINIIKKRSPEPERDLLIFILGCRTGLRQSAIIDIDISDINFKEKKLTVIEKGNVERDLFLDDDTLSLIQDYIDNYRWETSENETDALFVKLNLHNECVRINSWDMKVIIERATIDLDKRITPHKMRSTCATNLYLKTGDIFMVAEQLGHANIENTKKYTEAIGKAREASKIMGGMFNRR